MRTRHVSAALILAAMLALTAQIPQGQAPNQATMVTQTVSGVKFSTLPQFTVERVNPADNTDTYVVITFDSAGRLVVSKENDFPRRLIDANGDGIYEGEQVISDRVRNCQGIWFDGPTMYASCVDVQESARMAAQGIPAGRGGPTQRPAAVLRLNDTNGDGVSDSVETLGMAGSIQEHGPHAIRRRPDGGIAVLVGNNETIADPAVDLSSPILKDKDGQLLPYFPNFGQSVREGVHSAIFDWNPASQKFSVFSGGNRNAYDFAYNLAGEAFLFDSDMEWDIGLPWYRQVRTVHSVLNGNYGYRNGSGKYPDYYLDSLPPVRDLGRGSPVGVEFYTSYAYPRQFFDNFFEADWSRGRLLFTALTPDGATYSARADRAEFIHAEPLNITDAEVGPDGMMYFTTGGRNTAGGLWRLRYTGTVPAPPNMTGILAVVRQPQPFSSWGWAAIERVKATMGPAFATQLERLARNPAAASADRARALYEMQRHGAAPNVALLNALRTDASAEVRAAVVYIAGVQGSAASAVAAAAIRDANPMVKRRAAEALMRMGQSPERASLAPVADIYALLGHSDRFVRWAGRIALEHTPRADWSDRVLRETDPVAGLEGMLAWVRTANGQGLQPILEKQLAMLGASLSADNKLRLYRGLMYTITEVSGGLTPEQKQRLHGLIAPQFPAEDERHGRELALMLGYAGQPAAISPLLDAIFTAETQELQLHYLYALRVIQNGWTLDQKTRLAEVLGRASRWRGGAQFITFMNQYFDSVDELFASDQERRVLAEKAPWFAPLSALELEGIRARQAAALAGAAGGGGAAPAAAPAPVPVVARTQGRVLSRQEMFEETVYQPQQVYNLDAGRAVFEVNCASCHRFGSLGSDHGLPALNLTNSPLLSSKHALLEAIFFPDRRVAAQHRATVIDTVDGRTVGGLVLRDGATVSILSATAATTEVPRAQIKARRQTQATIMPDLADIIDRAAMRNLAAFLVGPPPGAVAGR